MRKVCLLLILISLVSCSRENSSNPPAEVEEKDSLPTAISDEAFGEKDWKTEYVQMDSVLDLTDQEKMDLEKAFEDREKEISEWNREKGEKLKTLEKEMFEAARRKDLDGMRKAKSQAEPLRDEIRAMVAKHRAKILSSASKENQDKWKGNLLSAKILDLMEPLALNEDQVKKIQDEAITAAKAVVKEPNPNAAGFIKLEKSVEKNVLTQEQKKEYELIKKRNPMRSLDFSFKDLKKLMDFQQQN